MARQTDALILKPTIYSRYSLNGGPLKVHSASFMFRIKTLAEIAQEFNILKTNEKATTITKGCKATARPNIAEQLKGHKFLIDRVGRELPISIGHFSSAVLDLINNEAELIPSDANEKFEIDLFGDTREAIRYKLLLKSIFMHGKLLFNNEDDPNLIMFRVDAEPCGEALVNAVFMNGSEDRDLFVSFTETTDFRLENVL